MTMSELDSKNKHGPLEDTYLSGLYKSQPLSLPEDIKAYVIAPKNIDEEINYLEKYIGTKDPDLTKIVFIVEILGKSVRKHSEFREYLRVVVSIIEKHKDYQYSIFCLRIIRAIVSSRFYIPVSFYLLRILSNAMHSRNITLQNKTVDYDCINPTPERTKSEEHQMFVIGEANSLLIHHLSTFSKNIGFPELAAVVINELKKLKLGIYKEVVGDMIFSINKQREYVLEKRSKLKLNCLDGKTVSSFESSIERIL